MNKKISQREARAMRVELRDLKLKLEHMFQSYRSDWPGVHVGGLTNISDTAMARIKTARVLGFVVIAVPRNSGELEFYAGKS